MAVMNCFHQARSGLPHWVLVAGAGGPLQLQHSCVPLHPEARGPGVDQRRDCALGAGGGLVQQHRLERGTTQLWVTRPKSASAEQRSRSLAKLFPASRGAMWVCWGFPQNSPSARGPLTATRGPPYIVGAPSKCLPCLSCSAAAALQRPQVHNCCCVGLRQTAKLWFATANMSHCVGLVRTKPMTERSFHTCGFVVKSCAKEAHWTKKVTLYNELHLSVF